MSAATDPVFEVRLPDPPPPTKAERERAAFFRLLPQLLTTHRGQYVAIHDEQVADSGTNPMEIARQIWGRVGKTDIYIGLVSDEPQTPVRAGRARNVVRWGSQR